jgi:hypothetical protein
MELNEPDLISPFKSPFIRNVGQTLRSLVAYTQTPLDHFTHRRIQFGSDVEGAWCTKDFICANKYYLVKSALK